MILKKLFFSRLSFLTILFLSIPTWSFWKNFRLRLEGVPCTFGGLASEPAKYCRFIYSNLHISPNLKKS